ncbi:MAG: hypothetical protein GY768_04185 [Planctomycetaceae bacterium]|nr:hypothetical protein [Planctomycetaceae bacterium]
MKLRRCFIVLLVLSFTLIWTTSEARAQAFGVELHNNLMPVSGAMGGASLANAQDLPSAINGNPANLARFRGTQFCNAGAWVEPTINISNDGGVLPGVDQFRAKSEAEGSALGNIAVSQDVRALGLPMTFGIGLIASSGAGISARDVPASNGTSALLNVLEIAPAVGIDLTDNVSVGANLMLGNSTFDGPFLGIGAAAYDYALRAAFGVTYDINCYSQIGAYYQTKQSFRYEDAIRLESPGGAFSSAFDVSLDLPPNFGIGYANERLMNGRLLLAVDLLYKQWSDADLFRSIYSDQWVVQTGLQYKLNRRVRLRLGYAYAENAMLANPQGSIGGIVLPGTTAALQYVQALLPAINNHRISGGFGVRDVLPGVDFDFFGGGMFDQFQRFGASAGSIESYWVGMGLTWRFGRGSCCRLPVPDQW